MQDETKFTHKNSTVRVVSVLLWLRFIPGEKTLCIHQIGGWGNI
jgi:hypothetical protein